MISKFAAAEMSLFGYGCRNELKPFIKREGLKKALVVTDEVLKKLGIVLKITDVLKEDNIEFCIYDGVQPNPTVTNVREGVQLYKENNCDFIVAIGGGSANDCAKAIGVMANNAGDIVDYVGGNKAVNKTPFLVAVNTTAGTGAEVSRAYLLSNEDSKLIFKDDYVMPNIAVNDIELMMGLPKSITAQTGMDALTHAIEGYISTGASKITNILNKEAIKLLYDNLKIVTNNPMDEEARDNMAHGQYLAGLGFGSAGLGMVHAMSHQLSAIYHTAHGLGNAILLPAVMKFYERHCTEKFAEILRVIEPGLARGSSDKVCAEILVDILEKLSEEVGTRISLRDINVKSEDLGMLADKALKDGCILSSPKIGTKEEIIEIYKSVY